MSVLIQLVGFGFLIAAATRWLGVDAGLAVAGIALLIIGEAIDAGKPPEVEE